MKTRVFCLILIMMLVLSACGAKESAAIADDNIGATIDFNASDMDISSDIESIDTDNIGASMDFEPIDMDLSLDVEAIDTENIGTSMDFEPIDMDLSLDIEAIDTENIGAVIDFELSDFSIDLDYDTFDSEEFVEDSAINFSASDMDILTELEPIKVAEIAEIKLNLLSDLAFAFEKVGLPVQVDSTTGLIALDSTVLFEVDKSDISDEGKALLNQFMQVYTYVVFNEKYDGFVSQILIEGHTDSDGDYDYNLALSQERAEAVLAYALSEECGIDAEYLEPLKQSSSATGYSYDYPVLDENGKEDKAASRRVTFRFLINVDA